MVNKAPVPECQRAKDIGIEMHSLSKKHITMTGWSLGFAVGEPEHTPGRTWKGKTNVDSGAFEAVRKPDRKRSPATGLCEYMNRIYKERRDASSYGLKDMGLEVKIPKAIILCVGACNGQASEFQRSFLKSRDCGQHQVSDWRIWRRIYKICPNTVCGQDK